MRIPSTSGTIILAAVLLVSGCRGKARVAYKDLVDDDAVVRSDAALRLGQAHAKDAIPSLIAVLNDPDEVVRVNVIRALGEIGDTSATPAILPYGADKLETVRMATCQALGMLKDPRAIPVLEKALYDESRTLRVVAARALSEIPGPESLETLVRVALQDEDDRLRSFVMKVIGGRRAKESVPRLESALAAESDLVRANAAQSLGVVGDRSSLPVLVRSLDDKTPRIRSLSAHAIAAIAPRDASAVAALAKRLAVENDGMARVDIAWSLCVMGDCSHLGEIRTLLFKGEPQDVRGEAAIALGEVGETRDIALLEKAETDRKGLVRSRAAEAIDKLKAKTTETKP